MQVLPFAAAMLTGLSAPAAAFVQATVPPQAQAQAQAQTQGPPLCPEGMTARQPATEAENRNAQDGTQRPAQEKGDGAKPPLSQEVGAAAGGTAGQIAGAAVAGPVGAAVGGLVAGRVGEAIGSVFKKKDKEEKQPQQDAQGQSAVNTEAPPECVPVRAAPN